MQPNVRTRARTTAAIAPVLEKKYQVSTDFIKAKQTELNFSVTISLPQLKIPQRPRHIHHSLMIQTMPVQPDYIDTNEGNGFAGDDDDLVESHITLSLLDPVSMMPLITPMRSRNCSHNECFDYDSFVQMNQLKPFKVVVRRYSNATRHVGEVSIMSILHDSKRPYKNPKTFNDVYDKVDYNVKKKRLIKDQRVQHFNSLEYFSCPICNIQFNINEPGDVYVVGEMCDLLQDLKFQPDYEEIKSIEIDMINKGQWKWLRKDQQLEKKIQETIISLDSDDEDFDPQSIVPLPKPQPPQQEQPQQDQTQQDHQQLTLEQQPQEQPAEPQTISSQPPFTSPVVTIPIDPSVNNPTEDNVKAEDPLADDELDKVLDIAFLEESYRGEPGVTMANGAALLPASDDDEAAVPVDSSLLRESLRSLHTGLANDPIELD